jgi:3-methyladenine DNA glycosylase AlkC
VGSLHEPAGYVPASGGNLGSKWEASKTGRKDPGSTKEVASTEAFLQFFPLIKQYEDDKRNFVKKAVNWALRQIGKRNSHLRASALECAYEIRNMDSKAARWVARDALKEFQAKEIKDEELLRHF